MVFCVIDNAVRALISSLVRIVCFPIVKRLESNEAYQARNLGVIDVNRYHRLVDSL